MGPQCACGSPASEPSWWHRTTVHDCVHHWHVYPKCVTCRLVPEIYDYLRNGEGGTSIGVGT